MTDEQFEAVASVEQLPSGQTLCVEVQGREVLICHTSEGIFAVDNLCSHAAERLSEGKLKGQRILCPLHGAAFDVRDGSALTRPAVRPIANHAVRVEGNQILVSLTET
ncbi:MAG: Rieske (2Fe-2S) protein [Pseudomonadales bacterium]